MEIDNRSLMEDGCKEPASDVKKGRGSVPYKQWLRMYDDDIRKDFPDRPTEDMAGEYDVNYYTMLRRAHRLGSEKSEAFMRSRWKKGGGRKGCKRAKFKEVTDEYMKEHFGDTSNAELAERFGVDVKTVRRWARRLGLQKSEEFMHRSRAHGRRYYTPEQKEGREQAICKAWHEGDENEVRRAAEELGISRRTLAATATSLGVSRSAELAKEARAAGNRKRTKYGPELVAAICKHYPDHTNKELAERFGIDPATIGAIAFNHGVKKSRGHMFRVHSEAHAMRKGKQKCD